MKLVKYYSPHILLTNARKKFVPRKFWQIFKSGPHPHFQIMAGTMIMFYYFDLDQLAIVALLPNLLTPKQKHQ